MANFSTTQAQGVPTYSETVLSGGFLENIETFGRFREFSGIFLNLRQHYTGPFGYEDSRWAQQAFDAWRSAYGEQLSDDFLLDAKTEFSKFSGSQRSQDIVNQMGQIFQDQQGLLNRWLTSIGVDSKGTLSRDMINGQAGMAILLSSFMYASDGQPSLDKFDDLSWIWPLCRSRYSPLF